MSRFAPAAARRLCALIESGDQRNLKHCGDLLGRCQPSAATAPLFGDRVFRFSVRGKSSHCGADKTRELSQLEPRGSTPYSTFSQSTVQLAKHSSKETSDRSRKKGSKKEQSEKSGYKLKPGQRPIVFECVECQAMCVTRILKDPYDRGISIVRCMDCRSVNLISDQLGLFKEPGSMHKFLSERGVNVRGGPERSYELTPEKLAEIEQSRAS